MSITIFCLHCRFECKGLTLHLKHKHGQTPAQYREQFPGAEIFSKGVRQQMSDSSYVAKFAGKPLEARLGVERSEAAITKMRESAGKHLLGTKRTDEYKEKMRHKWVEKRDEWSKAIRKSAARPEVKAKMSASMKKHIAENGYHLAKNRESSLEAFVRTVLENKGFQVVKQKGTKKATLGTVRFFDLFVPSLSLLIECDGEWWHRTPDRISIDKQKTEAARLEGLRLLRISDNELSRQHDTQKDADLVLSLLDLTEEQMFQRSMSLIAARASRALT
jgi:very-short-patch-repair endonuclease